MPVDAKSSVAGASTVGLAEVCAPIRPYLDALDGFLEQQVEELEPEIREMVRYALGHSGKRLRPILVAYGGWRPDAGADREALVRLGAVVELVHLATLVHDDILDDADLRRRHATVAARYGASSAVLLGDALFAHALKLASDFPTPEVCRAVAGATGRVCAGEISQTFRRGRPDFDLNNYFRIIDLKTAELFEAACRLGAELSGYDSGFARAAGTFGRRLGVAYQIFDDLIDLYGEEHEIGKTLGTDLGKGKFTLPSLLLLKKLPETERERMIDAFREGKPGVDRALAAHLREYPVFDEVARYFEDELQAAENALDAHAGYPPVEPMKQLTALLRGQVGRLA